MKTHRVHSGQNKFFRGEIMRCAACGVQKKSSSNVSSGWTVLEIEGGAPLYICPRCWGKILPGSRAPRARS